MQIITNISAILFLIFAVFGIAVALKIKNKKIFQIYSFINTGIITILLGAICIIFMDFAGAFLGLAPLIAFTILFLPRRVKHREIFSHVVYSVLGIGLLVSLVVFTENSIRLHFENREYLWLLLSLPLVVLTWYFTVSIINRWQNYASLVLRVVIIALIIIAVSGIRTVRSHDKLTVIFLIDRSKSMPKELSYDWYRNYIKEKINSSENRKPDDLYGVVLFAGKTTVFQFPTQNLNVVGVEPEFLENDATDIGSAIRQSLALFPEDSRKRLVIVTDGNSNRGDLFKDVSIAINQNVAVDVVTHESEKKLLDVRIDRFTSPMRIKKDTPYELKISINSTAKVKAKLTITQNGKQIDSIPPMILNLKPGNNYPILPLQVLNYNGFYEYNAEVEVLTDSKGDIVEDVIPENNSAKNFVIVQNSAKILYVYGDKEENNLQALRALQKGGKMLDIRPIADFPANNAHSVLGFYDLVIMSNVASSDWTSEQMEALKSAVHELGVGLIMLGGDKSYAPGGYYDQPIVEAWPLEMDIKEKRVLPSGALVIIMHTCEMDDGNYYAKVIAKTVVDTMNPRDELGIVIYTYNGGVKWLFPLQKIGNQKQALINKISNAPPEDMPNFDPAVTRAYGALLKSNAGMKHCIIISDGDPSMSNSSYNLVKTAYDDAGITTSCVCIFPEGGGQGTLKQIVQLGGPLGDTSERYWLINSNAAVNSLPKIFIREAARIKTQYNQNKKITGYSNEPAEFLKYLKQSASDGFLDGFVLTSLKPGASLPLSVDEEEQYPLLANWQYGLGKVVCFTSDVLSNGWGANWVGGDNFTVRVGENNKLDMNFTKFINDIASFASRKVVTTQQISSKAEYYSGKGIFRINRIDSRGRYVDLPNLEVKVVSPSSKAVTVKMRETRPGELEGEFEALQEGVYQIIATYNDAQNNVAFIDNGLSVPYPVEYRSFSVNERELKEIVKQSGGKFAKSELRAVSIQDSETRRTLSEFEYGVDTLRNFDNSFVEDENGIPKVYDPFIRDTKPTYSYLPTWILFALLAASILFFDVGVRRVQMNMTFLAVLASKTPILRKFFNKDKIDQPEEIQLLQAAKLDVQQQFKDRVSRLKKAGYAEDEQNSVIEDIKKNAKKAVKEEQQRIKNEEKAKKEKKKVESKQVKKPITGLDELQKAKQDALKKRKK